MEGGEKQLVQVSNAVAAHARQTLRQTLVRLAESDEPVRYKAFPAPPLFQSILAGDKLSLSYVDSLEKSVKKINYEYINCHYFLYALFQ